MLGKKACGGRALGIVVGIAVLVLLIGVLASLFSFQSDAVEIEPDSENNQIDNNSTSMVNTSQNTSAATNNIISITLEKPPFIKD